MFIRAVALAATALTAQALLLPPGIASASSPVAALTIDTTTQAIKLPCAECAFSIPRVESTEAEDVDDMFWIQGGANDLLLNFTLSEDAQSLSIDGYPLFQSAIAAEVANSIPRPRVAQVASSVSIAEASDSNANSRLLRVSEDTVFIGEEALPENTGSIVRLTYQVLAVEGQAVSVDGARVVMIKDTTGHLMIVNVEPVARRHSIFDSIITGPHKTTAIDNGKPSGPHHFHQAPPAKDCGKLPALLCKWKNVVENKVNHIKGHKGGCSGMKGDRKHLPSHIRPHIHWEGKPEDKPANFPGYSHIDGEESARPMRPHHGHPHAHHGHHGHHGHHRGHTVHRFLMGLVNGIVMVLIPIMAGITMGMTVSLVGILVGRLIAFCWIKFRRGGQRGYASVEQQDISDEVVEKGEVGLEETEPLPVYEEAPAYVEKEDK